MPLSRSASFSKIACPTSVSGEAISGISSTESKMNGRSRTCIAGAMVVNLAVAGASICTEPDWRA
jgi:hypothetical protein